MAGIKSLAKDTAVYGLSSIIGRFLNWCLVPLYTQMFPPGEYGEVIYIYTLVALALIVLTYGMETGFFRFANHEKYKDPMEVYSTEWFHRIDFTVGDFDHIHSVGSHIPKPHITDIPLCKS